MVHDDVEWKHYGLYGNDAGLSSESTQKIAFLI